MAKNKYWIGKGRAWVNDRLYGNVYKAEMKRTNNFEELPDPNGNGMVQVFTGYSIAGSMTMRKLGNEEILKELRADKNNELDISIVLKEYNKSTGQVERVKYIGVTVDEFPLSQFEDRTITEIELPLKAEDYEIL